MSRTLVLATVLLVLFGPAPARTSSAQGGLEDELRDYVCWGVSLFTQCQGGMTSCGALGATCSWCAVLPTAQVKDCAFSEDDGCTPFAGDPVSCGRQYNGVCVDNGSGGTICEGTSVGDCPNEAQDKCQ